MTVNRRTAAASLAAYAHVLRACMHWGSDLGTCLWHRAAHLPWPRAPVFAWRLQHGCHHPVEYMVQLDLLSSAVCMLWFELCAMAPSDAPLCHEHP
jgi:hypothetical protein